MGVGEVASKTNLAVLQFVCKAYNNCVNKAK